MKLSERISAIFNSPSRRKDIDYTKSITHEARTSVFLLLGQLHGHDVHTWFYKVGCDFVHLHQDLIHFWNPNLVIPHNPLLVFEEYLRQPSTKSVAFLDFLECTFRNENAAQDNELIRSINRVLEDKSCPYRLTEFVKIAKSHGSSITWHEVTACPMVYLAQESVVEVHAIAPVLALFADPDFAGADKSFRDALKRHKDGDYSGCVTSCAAAIESSIKVIAKKKRWRIKGKGVGGYTRSILVKSKLPKKLQSVAEFVAERRKNVGDAHGEEDVTEATEAEAQFLIGLAAALIVFLSSELP